MWRRYGAHALAKDFPAPQDWLRCTRSMVGWPSWSKARDSKSRRPLKGLQGSNPCPTASSSSDTGLSV